MAHLEPGDRAPSFVLADQDGGRVGLSDFRGRRVLLYFYPRANTPGCTIQACSVRDAEADLRERGAVALGISPDPPERQKKFDDKHGLGFPLLSDADHAVARAYGAWGEKALYGKKRMGIIRSSFLIDEEGRIVQARYKVKPKETVPGALDALGGM